MSVDGVATGGVHALDRGLQFGDGLFETMAVVDGKVRLLRRHLHRLSAGAEVLGLHLPDRHLLTTELEGAAADLGHGVLKLVITRGSGERGYTPPDSARPRRILISSDWPRFASEVRLMWCGTRLASGGSLAGIKHLNRLEQVLGSREVRMNGQVDEGLMLDSNGNVIEATGANLFLVDHQGGLVTPALDDCGVAGVMRDVVSGLAHDAGIALTMRPVTVDETLAAAELFLTSSITGIRPVIEIAGRSLVPGPVTQSLQDALAEQEPSCAG
ncbi:MAG: aminodeoxychorismate lyase [Gammaproteobacteria bacterium]|nr:aminodeoxychorismate lyase [Gammaproteobacteria bacterium]NNF61828.1 aminodeoxychorismate lyase [Gammaproteobacteria bacterium]